VAVSVVIYVSTAKYGEAALALAAGLLSAYAVDWTVGRFISFMAAWVGFTSIALLISSIRVAANIESIYRQAAISLSTGGDEITETERVLRKAGEQTALRSIGPVQRAEVIRLFAFRKLPIPVMETALRAVEILSLVTQIEPIVIAKFVTDVTRMFELTNSGDLDSAIQTVITTIRECPVPPSDFFEGFNHSRYLVLGGSVGPKRYFVELRNALEAGVAANGVSQYLEHRLRTSST
jgi:hypothetical protein